MKTAILAALAATACLAQIALFLNWFPERRKQVALFLLAICSILLFVRLA